MQLATIRGAGQRLALFLAISLVLASCGEPERLSTATSPAKPAAEVAPSASPSMEPTAMTASSSPTAVPPTVTPTTVATATVAPTSTPDATDPTATTELTLDEVFDRMESALTRDEMVYHASVTMQHTITEGGMTATTIGGGNVWIDGTRQLGRREGWSLSPNGEIDYYSLHALSEGYVRRPTGDSVTGTKQGNCTGAGTNDQSFPLVNFLNSLGLDCNANGRSPNSDTDENDPAAPRVETKVFYNGRPALAVAQGVEPSPPDPGVTPEPDQGDGSGFIIRIYIDQETFLPLGRVLDIYDGSTGDGSRSELSYESEFIPSSSFPLTFFSAHARFYAYPPLPDDEIVDGLIWVGDHVESANGFPGLELEWVGRSMLEASERTVWPRLELWYSPVNDAGNGYVMLSVMSAADWEFISQDDSPASPNGPCVQRTELALDGGSATIYSTYTALLEDDIDGCPDGPPDTHLATAQFGDTVVMIISEASLLSPSAPGYPMAPGPYDTPEGLEWLIRQLRPLV